jgi:ABC-type branched-subunit amino acid transport system ATPase component
LTDSETAIAVEHVLHHFGTVQALKDLNFTFPAGTIFWFVGPNGADKATTIKALLGLLEPQAGEISIYGHDPRHERPVIRILSAVLLEQTGIYERLSTLTFGTVVLLLVFIYGTQAILTHDFLVSLERTPLTQIGIEAGMALVTIDAVAMGSRSASESGGLSPVDRRAHTMSRYFPLFSLVIRVVLMLHIPAGYITLMRSTPH